MAAVFRPFGPRVRSSACAASPRSCAPPRPRWPTPCRGAPTPRNPSGPRPPAFISRLRGGQALQHEDARAAQGQLDGGEEPDRSGPHDHDIDMIFHILRPNMYSVHVQMWYRERHVNAARPSIPQATGHATSHLQRRHPPLPRAGLRSCDGGRDRGGRRRRADDGVQPLPSQGGHVLRSRCGGSRDRARRFAVVRVGQVAPIETCAEPAHRLVAEQSRLVEFSVASQGFMATIEASETLKARARAIRDELAHVVAAGLAEGAGREPADSDARLAAGLLLATWTVALIQAHQNLRQSRDSRPSKRRLSRSSIREPSA